MITLCFNVAGKDPGSRDVLMIVANVDARMSILAKA